MAVILSHLGLSSAACQTSGQCKKHMLALAGIITPLQCVNKAWILTQYWQ